MFSFFCFFFNLVFFTDIGTYITNVVIFSTMYLSLLKIVQKNFVFRPKKQYYFPIQQIENYSFIYNHIIGNNQL